MRLNVIFAVTGVVACLGLAVLARADYESEVMADHPLVYYRFEDATCNSGDTCKDSANNLYKNGTYQVNGSWSNLVFEAGIPGPSGQAIRFNGSGSGGAGHCVDIWDGNAIVASNMTVEVWMMSTDVNNYPRLLQHNGKYNDPNNYGIGEYNDVSGGHITVMGGGSTWYTGTPAIWDGNWHLIDVTYQQIDTNLYEYVYIDGVGIWGHTVDNASLLKHYDRLTLGCEGNRWYCDNGFNGRLDEVAIYDTVLDANRIALHYALGLHATGTLQFKSSTYTIAESGGSIRIYVSRADGSYGSASVNYATADDTATAGSDYTVESGTLNWSDGDANDKYFDVNIIDDSIAENNETFDVNLSDANGASLGSPSQTTVTILINDQPAGSLQFNSSTYTVAENGGSIRIYVGRTDGSYGEASVNYATADDTATAGSDYTAESGTLNWSDGDANDKYFDVNIIDDSIAENNETFDVNLSDANGASLGSPSQTIVTIDDNDSPIISGYVRTPNDVNISGVTMTGWPGSAPVTDSSGYYFGIVPHGWSGTITPSKSLYIFGSKSYTDATTDQDNQDYISTSWIFGTYQNLKNASITVPDSNGALVTFKLTRGGWGDIVNDDSNFGQINLQGTNETSIFSIKTPSKQDTNVGDINVAGPLKSITAKTTNLQGNITVSGSLGTLILNDVADNHTITIGASLNPKAATMTWFDVVNDLVINSRMPIKTITTTDWIGGEVNAPSLGRITIRGDKKRAIAGDLDVNVMLAGSINRVMVAGTLSGRWSCNTIKSITGANIVEANLVLSQQPNAKISALGKLTAKGWIDSSQIQSRGNIGTVTAGAMYDSICFAGVTTTNDLNADGVLDLPDPATDINDVNLPTIKKISINGIKGDEPNSVINSNIAASQILSAYLAYPQIDNNDVNFGISSGYIKTLKIKDNNEIHKLNNLDEPNESFAFDDLNILLN